jgi:hypothetical protein
LADEVDRWGPAFAHLFGVHEDDVRLWPLAKFYRYREYASARLRIGGEYGVVED